MAKKNTDTATAAAGTDGQLVMEIYKPSAQDIKAALSSMWRFNKDDIIQMALPFARLSRSVRLVYRGHASEGVPKEIAAVKAVASYPKAQWEQFLAIFLNEENFPLLFRGMPEGQLNLWYEVATRHYLDEDRAAELLGQLCMKKDAYYRMSPMNSVLNNYFTYVRACCVEKDGYGTYKSYLCLYPFYNQLALRIFYPDQLHVHPQDSLPDDAALTRYSAERMVLSRLPLLQSLYAQGRLDTGPNFKISNTTVKAAQRVAGIPDFFPEGTLPKLWPCAAAKMLMNEYSVYRLQNGRRRLPDAPEDLLKAVVEQALSQRSVLLPVVLPYLKGLTHSVMYANEADAVATMLQSILATWNKGWLQVDNIIMRLRTMDENAEWKFLLMDHNRCERMKLKNGLTDRYIHTDERVEQMCIPFVKGLLFLMGAFGMVELAYRLPAEGDASYYSGLRYVRLTTLGRYILGLDDTYTPQPDEDERPLFTLDDDHLIIQSLVDDNPLESVVCSFARRITPRLYKVTPQTVLANCATLKDVEGKIASFYRFVCPEPGQAWNAFFDTMKAHCRPFSKPADKYELLCVDRDDADLHRLLLTAPDLRRLVVKAEDYLLLVKTADKELLAKTLLKYGYLM